jgi:tetratricopeptide (TPR) repeat protein
MTDDYLEQMLARRKRQRKIAAWVVGGAAAIALIAWGPGWMIERAEKSALACSNADFEDAPNPKTDCTGGKLWLLFPKIVPWKHSAAMKMSHAIDRDSAERKLKFATTLAPSADEQGAAIAALTALHADGQVTTDAYIAILGTEGAAWRASPAKTTFDSGFAQNTFIHQTLQHGSIDDVITFVHAPPKITVEDYSARDMFMERGALLCLDGAVDAGQAAFHEAIRVNAMHHDFPFHEARIGLAACGEPTIPNSMDADRDALWSFDLGQSLGGAALEERMIGSYSSSSIRDGNESPFVAFAIVERDRPLEQLLQIVSVLSSMPTAGLSVWPWETPHEGYPVLVDPERDEKAAERLEAASKTAPEKQNALTIEERIALRMPAQVATRYEKAHQTPAAALRNAARGFWLEAAGTWSRMGQADRAEAAARRLRALRETDVERVYLAAALMRCGRFDAAAEIAANEADVTPVRMVVLVDIRVQALMHAGKFDEARTVVKRAIEQTASFSIPADSIIGLLADRPALAFDTSYLDLAIRLKTGDLAGAPAIETPTIYERDKTTWTDLIAKPESERSVLRWRMRDFDEPSSSVARPAVLFVVGKATDGDAETWLDKEVFPYNPFLRGVPYMRARAEAARWRGDAKAEAAWLSRAVAVEKRLTDPKKLALAKLAGL